jgi:hypothetical protein
MALFCLPLVQKNYYVRKEFVMEQYGLNKIANETRELQHLTLLPFINIVSIYINFDTICPEIFYWIAAVSLIIIIMKQE